MERWTTMEKKRHGQKVRKRHVGAGAAPRPEKNSRHVEPNLNLANAEPNLNPLKLKTAMHETLLQLNEQQKNDKYSKPGVPETIDAYAT